MSRTVLITGCSTGIGRALALELHGRGLTVCATARRPETLAELHAAGLRTYALDVCSPASIAALAEQLRERLALHHSAIQVSTGSRDPRGCDLVVNATPLGMNDGDPLPFDVSLLSASTFVGEVVMRREVTPLLAAAQARGCRVQVGTDMLFEQIPAYLEFFGFPSTTPQALRATARLPADS